MSFAEDEVEWGRERDLSPLMWVQSISSTVQLWLMTKYFWSNYVTHIDEGSTGYDLGSFDDVGLLRREFWRSGRLTDNAAGAHVARRSVELTCSIWRQKLWHLAPNRRSRSA